MTTNPTTTVHSVEDNTESVDITFLIDDDFQPKSTLSKAYEKEIPTDGFAYKLYSDKIMADLMQKCKCKNNCRDLLMKDPVITKQIQHLRSQYYITTPIGNERKSKTIDLIRTSLCVGHDGHIRQHNFMGHIICMKKWMDLLGISKATYYRSLACVQNGFYSAEDMRKQTCSNVRGLDACGFIELCLEKYGDYSPERQKILLPSCVNIKFIFEEYLESPGLHVKEKQFYKIFKNNFEKAVSFAKTRNINPCDICVKAGHELPKLHDLEAKRQLKEDLKIHLDRQCIERKDYYKKGRRLAQDQQKQ